MFPRILSRNWQPLLLLAVVAYLMTFSPFKTRLQSQLELVESLTQELASNPGDSDLLEKRAGTCFDLGNWEQALTDTDAVLKAKPKTARHHYQRSHILGKLGRWEEAVQSSNETLQNDHEGLYNICYNNRAYFRARMGEFEQAIPDVEHALELFPKNAECRDTLGYIYVGLQRYPEAIRVYEENFQGAPEDKYALWGRAACYYNQGQNEAALKDVQAALKLDSAFCLHWTSFSWSPDIHSCQTGLAHQI